MKKIGFLALSLSLATVGCATFEEGRVSHDDANEKYTKSLEHKNLELAKPSYQIELSDRVYVATATMPAKDYMPSWLKNYKAEMKRGDEMSLSQIAAYLSKRTGIAISRSSELIKKEAAAENSADIQQEEDMSVVTDTVSASSDSKIEKYIPTGTYKFEGGSLTFPDLLSRISSSLGISWRYDANKGVEFYFYETHQSVINYTSLVRGFEFTNTNAASTSDEGGDGGSIQTLGMRKESSFFDEIEETIEANLSAFGVFDLNRVTGLVTVTDSEAAIKRVQSQIDRVNSNLDLSMHAKITLVSIDVENSANFSFDLNAVYNSAENALVNLTTNQSSAANVIAGVTDTGSRWNGTQVFIEALETQGETSVVHEKEYYLRNYIPRQIKIGETLRYISSSQTETDDSGEDTTTVEENSLFTGSAMTIYPHIISESNAILDMSFALNEILEIQDVDIDGNTIRLPQTTGMDDTPSVRIKNGQAQAAMIVDITRASKRDAGTIASQNCLAGCDRSQSESKRFLVFIVSGWII